MNDLLKLAERSEQATGPNRELDVAVMSDCGLTDMFSVSHAYSGAKMPGSVAHPRLQRSYVSAPKFTASLDAAMTLVPDDWSATVVRIPGHASEAGVLEWRVDDKGKYWRPADGADSGKCRAASPPLALCAAALRARAAHAIATEARRAETTLGSVHEGAGPQDIAQKVTP